MGGLAHYLEREGLTTVNIALVHKHAIAQPSPRALWVPFWYGRPFGAPNQPVFQRRVLDAALDLLDEPTGRVLKEYDRDAPDMPSPDGWEPPFQLPAPPDEVADTETVIAALKTEVAEMAGRHPAITKAKGRTFVGLSQLDLNTVADLIAVFLQGEEKETKIAKRPGLALKFGCQEIIDAYAECVFVTAPDAPLAFRRWYWQRTAAGLAVRRLQEVAVHSTDVRARVSAENRAFVPREWHM